MLFIIYYLLINKYEWKEYLQLLCSNIISSVRDKTGLPVSAHNRWWSDHTVYAKQNGGQYNFIVEKETSKALPLDQSFWNDLIANSTKWGLMNYEQVGDLLKNTLSMSIYVCLRNIYFKLNVCT